MTTPTLTSTPTNRIGCETWTDHQWDRRAVVKQGDHQTRGHFQVSLVTCARCGKTMTETLWLDRPHVWLPVGPKLATCAGE